VTFAPDALPGEFEIPWLARTSREGILCTDVPTAPLIELSILHAKASPSIQCMLISILLEFYYDIFVTVSQKCKMEGCRKRPVPAEKL